MKSQNLDTTYTSQLANILTQYFSEIGYLNALFGLLLLQVGALVLFFLVVMVALVRRGERREIAMLQSRGAFDRQIVLLCGIEALVICVAAALAAPFITRQILIWAAPLFASLPHLPLVLDGVPFLYSSLAAGLALIVLVGTLRPVLRLPLILAGGSASRGDKHPWWQRYYLDVLLLIVGSAALFRLLTTASPLTQTALGSTTADPLLLITPALLFVALGSITLRLFPAMADAAARFFSKRRTLTGALATWQVSREPAHYGRISFLLALAIGIGWFATSFQATVAHSQSDQAHYAVGTDLRFSEQDSALDTDRVQPTSAFTAQAGVASDSVALRLDKINFSLSGKSSEPGTILAVDPATFASTAAWRVDLGSLPLPTSPNLAQTGAAVYANEAWLRLEPGVSSSDFLQQARLKALNDNYLIIQTQTLDDALDRLRSDALSQGLAGLLFIAFAVALALSAASPLTYTALTLQSRRNEFAVLRTLGFASSQLIASIALEQALVFVTAVLLGALLGYFLSERVLPTLAFNTSGTAITPPFIVQVETPVLLQYGLILLLVLALVLGGSLLLVRRMSLAQALRYSEE